MFLDWLWLIIGMVLLIKGADFFVDGASKIAKALKIPTLIIGLTLVSMGTSAPELSVSLNASLIGSNDISFGNVIGSNIFNILLVLGLATTIKPINISFFAFIDILFMVGITILLYLFMKKDNCINKKQGIVLVLMYIAYMAYTIMR